MMRAARLLARTGPSGVEIHRVPVPRRGEDEVLVTVRAAGVTFPDLLMSYGRYQDTPELPCGLGGEFAGVVRAAPSDSGLRPGDPVACSYAYCGFAEVAAVPLHHVLPLRADIPFATAACLPSNYLTMTFGLLRRARMRAGETVVVHGASGGVGVAAMQLASAFGGRVIAVTSTPLTEVVSKAGYAPDHVVPVDDFPAAVEELTGGRGADIVVDPVGGDRIVRSLDCVAPAGRVLVLGFAGGTIPVLRTDQLGSDDVEIVGVGWGAFLATAPEMLRVEWDRLQPLVARGLARPPIDQVLPLDRTAEALARLESRAARGRIVLAP